MIRLTCEHLALVRLQCTDEVPLDVGRQLSTPQQTRGQRPAPLAAPRRPNGAHLLRLRLELLGVVLPKVPHAVLVQRDDVRAWLQLRHGHQAGLHTRQGQLWLSFPPLRKVSSSLSPHPAPRPPCLPRRESHRTPHAARPRGLGSGERQTWSRWRTCAESASQGVSRSFA